MKITKRERRNGVDYVKIAGRWVRKGFVATPSTDADRARILAAA